MTSDEPPRDPWRALACAVVVRALYDAVAPISPHSQHAHRPTREGQAEARHFLLRLDGGWARARAFWSDLAGVCPHALRDRAKLAIEGGIPSLTFTPTGQATRRFVPRVSELRRAA